jgi:hypothetical protein
VYYGAYFCNNVAGNVVHDSIRGGNCTAEILLISFRETFTHHTWYVQRPTTGFHWRNVKQNLTRANTQD